MHVNKLVSAVFLTLLFALSGQQSAYAASFASGCDCEITIPKYQHSLAFSAELLFMQPDEGGSNYALQSSTVTALLAFPLAVTIPAGRHDLTIHSVGVGKQIGYGFDFGYRLKGTGHDLRAVYNHWMGADSDRITETLPGSADIQPLGFAITPVMRATTARARVSYDTALFDAEVGQRLQFGQHTQVRAYVGVRFASIMRKIRREFTTLADQQFPGFPNDALRASEENQSNFQGWGPRMGDRVHFKLKHGFAINLDLSAALLVGNGSDKYHFEDMNAPQNAVNIKTRKSKRIVPVVDAALSADFTHVFKGGNQLVIESGYRLTNFFNSVQQESTNVVPVTNDANLTDFGRHGVFLRVVGLV